MGVYIQESKGQGFYETDATIIHKPVTNDEGKRGVNETMMSKINVRE
jgi:hypothetical protein